MGTGGEFGCNYSGDALVNYGLFCLHDTFSCLLEKKMSKKKKKKKKKKNTFKG